MNISVKERMSTRMRLFKNFTALSTLQATEYLLPLITMPYIIRIIGPEKFGLLAFATAFTLFFQMFTEYGLSYTATRDIAYHKEDKKKLEEIYNSVLTLKLLLLILSFMLFAVIIFAFNKFRTDSLIYLLTFGTVIGNVMLPSWFYQGLQKMKSLTVISIITKIVYTIGVFMLIKEVNDYVYIPLINALCLIIGSIIALLFVKKISGVKMKMPKATLIKHWIKRGGHVSSATILMSIYLQSRTVILGLFTNNTIVGFYSIAEKLTSFINSFPLNSFLSTLMPQVTTVYKENKMKG